MWSNEEDEALERLQQEEDQKRLAALVAHQMNMAAVNSPLYRGTGMDHTIATSAHPVPQGYAKRSTLDMVYDRLGLHPGELQAKGVVLVAAMKLAKPTLFVVVGDKGMVLVQDEPEELYPSDAFITKIRL